MEAAGAAVSVCTTCYCDSRRIPEHEPYCSRFRPRLQLLEARATLPSHEASTERKASPRLRRDEP